LTWAGTSTTPPNKRKMRQRDPSRSLWEYPEGVFTPVTYSGNLTVVVPAGGLIQSDPVNVSIPAGAKFWERTVNVSGATVLFPVIVLPDDSVALGIDDGNAASDQGDSGSIPPTTGVNTFGSAAILGTVAASNARSFVIQGDSIAFGEDDKSGVGSKGGSGFVARMLDEAGVSPYVKIAMPGQQSADAVSLSERQQAFLSTITFSDAIIQSGINDLPLGRTQSQVLADRASIASWVGGAQVYYTTLTPRSDSTNGYITTANQTPKTDGTMSSLTSLNEAIRALPGGVDGVIDAADAAMPTRNANVWTAPPAATADGTHPNTPKCISMAAALSSQVAV
jgi:hypothetical protein